MQADRAWIDAKGELDLILAAGEEAGHIAMRHFGHDPAIWYKNNGTSPVSAADIAVDEFLKGVLLDARPGYGWLSEETVDDAGRLTREALFVVDPIDGTRAFIAGKETWCVSIAVVEHGLPIAGVLVAPALGEVFAAVKDGVATKNGAPLPMLVPPAEDETAPLRLSAPQTLAEEIDPHLGRSVSRMPHVPSLAYRLAMLADGRLDATFVKPRANDWDIAAGDLILSRVGGSLLTVKGESLHYNRPVTDHGVLVGAHAELAPKLAANLDAGMAH